MRAQMSTKRRQRDVAALVLALSATAAHGEASLEGKILDFGPFVARHIGEATEARGNLGRDEYIEDIRFLDRTDRVEAQLCRHFGMTVRLTPSPPAGMPAFVRGRTLHPRLTRPDGRQAMEERSDIVVEDGVAFIGFGFDQDWELVPGRWTFVLSSPDGEIVRKDFTVTAPPSGPSDSDCELVAGRTSP